MRATYIIQSFINFILSVFSTLRRQEKPVLAPKPTYPPILDKIYDMGFEVVSHDDYHLNIIGIRTNTETPNKFDDHLFCVYQVDGKWIQHRWNITTDPGTYWLHYPLNDLGTACVVANRQYKNVWQLGKHRGRYKALVQSGGKIAVHRDNNKDNKINFDTIIEEGYFGINCHRATTAIGGSVDVGKWSAGCQVFQDPDDFKKFIDLCVKQRESDVGSKFTYTLLNEWCIMEELDWDNE